jgi:hypothetical protein
MESYIYKRKPSINTTLKESLIVAYHAETFYCMLNGCGGASIQTYEVYSIFYLEAISKFE